MTAPSNVPRRRGEGALLTVAWYAVVLLVVFTIAFWLGRTVGPSTTEPDPVAPHAPMEGH